jgi:outer membrane immunogenic protein
MNITRLVLAGAATIALATAAQAADLITPPDPIYSSSLFNFEGMYVGGTAGFITAGGIAGSLGGVVGANFAVTDGIIAGVEFQGDLLFSGGGLSSYDALALGRVGGFISDNTMLYGDVGLGVVGSTSVYAFGGGLEMGLTDQLSVRGDVQGLGAWSAMPSAAKATVGLMWHMN